MIRIQNIYYMLSYAFQILKEGGYTSCAAEEFENTAAAKGLLIHEWSAADVDADVSRCGKSGSPTNVKQIMSVVLTAGDFKKVEPTEEGVSELIRELIEDHTLG